MLIGSRRHGVYKRNEPRHLAFDKDGTHVFCANELRSTVSVLEYEDGTLTLKDTVSLLPKDFDGESTAAAIRCADGTVYVSNRGHDSITALTFSSGRLAFNKTISTYGRSPRDFLVYRDLIIAANECSDEVTLISLEDGGLLEKIPVRYPVCVAVNSRTL